MEGEIQENPLNRRFVKVIGHVEIKKKIPRRFSSFAKFSLQGKLYFLLTCMLAKGSLIALNASELRKRVVHISILLDEMKT